MSIVRKFIQAKKNGQKLTLLTAYEALTAAMLEAEGVDCLLVGDSVGMVLLGYSSTLPVTMDEMIHHAKAVRRGAPKSFVIGDLPLKGIERGPRQALQSSKRFMKEAKCDAVKIEWHPDALKSVALLVKNKIPVMAHIGLTPQNTGAGGKFKVQGQEARRAAELLKEALLLEKAGVFAVLLECVPIPVARVITGRLKIPTIGIGAGPYCDGQVLVFQDMIGLFKKFSPRFVKRFADADALMRKAVRQYAAEVKGRIFPSSKEGFLMNEKEADLFGRMVE
ncbi:MAG: 3-methyl-2-oxobutanoate hydroxymethyltransferase [Candidatus Omnitrophica bacterium]|nr:3-methyl-2-oxobutanoate hydroxymethyltransferase [Candidatus Omnitrophota bacterium]